MRCAVIDAGSNTIKMLVADRDAGGGFTPVYEAAHTVRLAEASSGGRLTPAAIDRAAAALAEFAAVARDLGVDSIAAVGTAAIRNAVNRDELVDRAAALGVRIEPISGDEEARLSYLAIQRDPHWAAAERLFVADIGGASTELIVGDRIGVGARVSTAVGAVSLTEGALSGDPPGDAAVEAARRHACKALTSAAVERVKGLYNASPNHTAVGVGGTFVNMARVACHVAATAGGEDGAELAAIHGAMLTRDEVERQIRLYAGSTVEQRRAIPGLAPTRADIILGGAVILREVMDLLALPAVAVSVRGLRWGVMYDRFGDPTGHPR